MKKALILIDIQNDYFPGGKMEFNMAEKAGVKAGQILTAARKNGFLVIHIKHLSTRPGATFFIPV
jgi:nicotinamidase-related amidase